MEITAYISINLLLFSAWNIFLFRKKNCLSFADRLIGTFIAGLTQIIATEMLLGVVFRKLYPLPLFIINALISTGIIVVVLLSGGCRGIIDEMRDEALRVFRIIREDIILLCLFGLFCLSVLWLVFTGYLFPSYSWDALYYHLPIVGQIIQSGTIQENPTPSFIQQYMNIFSKNVNLFFVWNVIFLKSEVIVDLSQLFFTLAGVLAIYSMALKQKIREKYAVYAALLFFFTPVLILQSTTNYVDAAVSMLFLVALNFGVNNIIAHGPAADHTVDPGAGNRVSMLFSGLAAGILLGSKPTGPLFIFVLAGVMLTCEVIKHIKPQGSTGYGLKHGLKTFLVCFMLPVFLIGGYWYMRNWVFYGNPVYYMDISVFNVPLFKGLERTWVEPAPPIIENLNYLTRLFYVWLERVSYYMYDSRLSGFGPIWFILFLPSILFSLTYAIRKKKYGILFVGAVCLVTFLVHPRNWTPRYVIFIVGLGALSFALLMDYFHKREKIIGSMALLLAVYIFLTANSPCIMPRHIQEFLHLSPAERTLSRLKPFNIDTKVRNEYGYWIWIDNNVTAGDTLAYTFESFDLDTSRPFFTRPLWNRGFSNRVVYVKSGTYKEWLRILKDSRATYILMKKNSPEDRWVENERKIFYSLSWMGNIREKFRVVYDDKYYKIVEYIEGVRTKAAG